MEFENFDSNTIAQLSDEELSQLQQAVGGEAERRRPKVMLEEIKPGMSEEKTKAAWAEINRVLGANR